MHRFYCQHADFSRKTLSITDRNEIHHIKDVLRLKVGDEVCIFNGRNQEALVTIAGIKEGEIEVNVATLREVQISKTRIILACAVPKKAKFELIIEKCTELGVDEIIPLKTRRTEVVFSQDKLASKQERFQKVAVNAAKQCGRANIPQIAPMTAFTEALKRCTGDMLALIPSLNGRPKHMRGVLTDASKGGAVLIFIGPEGDFTPDEVQAAVDKGAVPVSLGHTVLKVDTAAISAVALAHFWLE